MILDQFKLDERVALVTGASTGLGAAIAIALAEAGAQVACHGNSRSPESTCDQIKSAGGVAHAISGDLGKPETPENLVAETLDRFGRIDILINNAGTIRRAPAVDYSDEDWATVIEVNLSSVFRLSKLAGKQMIERGARRQDRQHRLVAFVSRRHHCAGVRCVERWRGPTHKGTCERVGQTPNQRKRDCSGYMRTANTAALQADETRNRQILERIPAGRWGEPEDLAGAAVFLSSRASDYINGHMLVVDGGWMGR